MRMLVVLVLLPACTVPFEFGSRPLPLPSRDNAEQCYFDNRMELSNGNASLEWSNYVGWGWYSVTRERVGGLVFYQGGKRLSPKRAVAILRDKELEDAYRAKLDKLAADRSRLTNRVVIGAGVSLGGTAVMTVPLFVDTDSPGLYLAAGGIAYAVGLGMIVSAYRLKHVRPRHQVYEKLFIEKGLVNRLGYAVLGFNQTVASRCGYRGEVDIPMPKELSNQAPSDFGKR